MGNTQRVGSESKWFDTDNLPLLLTLPIGTTGIKLHLFQTATVSLNIEMVHSKIKIISIKSVFIINKAPEK